MSVLGSVFARHSRLVDDVLYKKHITKGFEVKIVRYKRNSPASIHDEIAS